MSALDDFLEDDEWDSDHESQPQDVFNRSTFNAVTPLSPGDIPPPVNARANQSQAQVVSDPKPFKIQANLNHYEAPKPKPTLTREERRPLPPQPVPVVAPRKEVSLEQTERAQAAVVAVSQPKVAGSALGGERKLSVNIVRKPSANFSRKGSVNLSRKGSTKFAGRYDTEIVAFFTEMNKKSITDQAIEYLNAYWDEVGDQAEFIFSVAHRIFREADMHRQGITLYYKYEEGSDVDYPTYLYFYEKLCKFVSENPQWRQGQYEKSAVYEVKTAIKHKNDLMEKVDVNFDGQISFLEFLLYQYNVFSNPAGFMERARRAGEEAPEVIAARAALEEVNRRIKAYEEERARLEAGAKQAGVKGLTFKHQLTMLDKSPLAEELNKALITAEAAVRLAIKKFGGRSGSKAGGTPRGALWWMNRDLEEKKKFRAAR